MSAWLRKLGWVFTRARRRRELEEELTFHLEAEREEREAAGEAAADARRHARLDFGNVALVREDTRSTWSWRMLEQLGQDLRYGLRTMRRSPAFAVLAIASLALGIGANTAIFGFMDAMLLRQLPVPDAERLVRMTWRTPRNEMHGTSRHNSDSSDPQAGFTGGVFAYQALGAFQQHADLFSHVFAYQGTGLLTVTVAGQAESANGEFVTGDYFSGLGVTPAAGRWLEDGDDRFGAPAVAVISLGFSRARFSTTAEAIGQTIAINARPFTVIGVMPASFFGTDPGRAVDLYVPLHASPLIEESASAARERFFNSSTWWLEIMARRRPGISLERVQAELGPPFKQTSDDLKANSRRWQQSPSLEVVGGGDGIDGLRRTYRTPLYMLIALSGLILTLACTNIANLLLARSRARAREMAVRLSVGAGRGRIVRQLVTESLLLSCLGGSLGIGVALWTQSWVSARLNSGPIPFGVAPSLNWQVLGVALALSLATGVLFGLAPAFAATQRRAMPALKSGRGMSSAASWRGASSRRLLLIAQIAITLVLLVAAGLFLRTLRSYQSIELGFSSDHVLTFALRADQAGLGPGEAAALYREIRERLAALPGVQAVGMSDPPLIGDGRSFTTIEPVDQKLKQSSQIIHAGGGFFETMRLPIVKGRAITADDDRVGAAPVAVVDETYVRLYLAGRDPIGQYLRIPGEARFNGVQIPIVGVARNARIGSLRGEPDGTVYFPFTMAVFGGVGRIVFEIRTVGEPAAYASAARAVVREANPGVPVVRVATQDALIESTISRQALLARLCATFAGIALMMAIVGLSGTVLHDVSRRRSEIGIRMALGARHGQVVAMVLREVVLVVGLGLVAGIPAAASATKISEALLFGVTRGDVPTTAGAMAVLAAAALVAGFIPARGAAKVSPTVALRNE